MGRREGLVDREVNCGRRLCSEGRALVAVGASSRWRSGDRYGVERHSWEAVVA